MVALRSCIKSSMKAGFTLIEMSIVLVIIGLIIGGVLVGQDLIRVAETRATIGQIEKFNAAVNTFRGKYGFLPGDINSTTANAFGFAARGTGQGQGDGNGEIEGLTNNGLAQGGGETVMFWVDLSRAGLINGGFKTASSTLNYSTDITGTIVDLFLPQAKLGGGNYFYVYSGTYWNGSAYSNTSINYFGLSSAIDILSVTDWGYMDSTANIPVTQAYAIDSKIDDGMPQSGNVMAWYLGNISPIVPGQYWTDGTDATLVANEPKPYAGALAGSSTTCYDNSSASSGSPGIAGAITHYSLEIKSGTGANCALSFKFQ